MSPYWHGVVVNLHSVAVGGMVSAAACLAGTALGGVVDEEKHQAWGRLFHFAAAYAWLWALVYVFSVPT